jgi:hypothetical protein
MKNQKANTDRLEKIDLIYSEITKLVKAGESEKAFALRLEADSLRLTWKR